MLIAIASKSGELVDQHFGQAEMFRIYDYKKDNPQQISAVSVNKFSDETPGHSFSEQRFSQVVAALQGCRAVAVSQIGEIPEQQLILSGIQPVKTQATIVEALKLAHDSVCTGKCQGGSVPGGCPHQ
ncbi:Predicted Fe-Mo cluster-binding protein, NifX family [Desulfuromusa kysingii]|uniref:Predicted Fe-Mo cluster-binding protein, NifX family n=1 Tax=Desulfuromusa kysingii TaxID=37625 RepID=A0A1H4DIY6_9BACT|nr:NifB/NifX family molybdenum-iron cluster-binding protein [Desulfuromusa kysingii]SEA72537.1 Predicted Fe-Mo cluster-binding protein, NifX family [Desulfuromusa kysingii]